ncbi:MAG: fused MFS/spermidine synthase [Acidobacteriota bacterium]
MNISDQVSQLRSVAGWALVLVGFSAVIGQIVLMRELMVVFNGNEMSLGIMLATWLLWTAVGSRVSGIGRRRQPRNSRPRWMVAALECLLAASLPATIWALRSAKPLLQTVPGELLGPAPMLAAALVSLSVFCAVSGALFVAAAHMYEEERGVAAPVAAGSAYLLEAIGSALGGILASLVLLRFLESFQIAAIVALLNVGMAAAMLLRMRQRQAIVLAVAEVLVAVPLLAWVAPRIDRAAQVRLWRGLHLVATRDTIYGNLAITEVGTAGSGAIRSIWANGMILANAPDPSAAEEAVHYALLEHPAPRRVLLIGGGVNGGVAEALKHPTVERIDYVELDPALISMARQFFPAQAAALQSDPRAHIHFADGRRYLKAASGRFDVILVDVPDPQTAQLNRFYTVEFFRSARAHLAPGGLLALQLTASEETLSPNLETFLRCIRHTLEQAFPFVAAIPGGTIHFFAAVQPAVLTDDPQVLIARLRERRVNTLYVSQYFIPYRMMPDRMKQVRDQLRPSATTPVNRDFAPVAYFFDVVLWSSQFRSGYAGWFHTVAGIPFRSLLSSAASLLFLIAVLIAFAPGRQNRARSAAAFCTAATGFTLMTLQIFVLLTFQSVYGFVYYQLSILIGLFMAGIAAGSWLGLRGMRLDGRAPTRKMAVTQFLLALAAPVLMCAVGSLARASGPAATWIAAQLVFPALAALSGVLGGYQFPIAARIFLPESTGKSGLGVLYAIDLIGGCAGALVLSSYLIPVFGFWPTAWLCAAINLAAFLPALRAGRSTSGAAAASVCDR